jgi:hypothetical protein
MTLSPEERREILGMIADRTVDAIRSEVGDLTEFVVLPLAAAGQLVGLSAAQVKRLLPITRTGSGKHGITLAAIKRHITTNTKQP